MRPPAIENRAVDAALPADRRGIDRRGEGQRGDPRRLFEHGPLLAGSDVPQAELDLEAAVLALADAADDQRLGVDRPPVGEARRLDLGGPPAELDVRLDAVLRGMMDRLKADDAMVFLSDLGSNYRKDHVYPEYKQNRAGVHRPILFRPIRDYLIEAWNAQVWPRLEGDDMLSIMATTLVVGDEVESIMCSIDKDLLTVPGLHFNWDKPGLGENGVTSVDEGEAEWRFLAQVLTGDSVDGYPGCPKIGPVKAEKILDRGMHLDEVWDSAILPTYKKAGLGEEYALAQARCAWLLRKADTRYLWFKDDKGKDVRRLDVRLWNPRTSRDMKEIWV